MELNDYVSVYAPELYQKRRLFIIFYIDPVSSLIFLGKKNAPELYQKRRQGLLLTPKKD